MIRLFQLISYAVTITLIIIIWNAVTYSDGGTTTTESKHQDTSIQETITNDSLYEEIESIYDPDAHATKQQPKEVEKQEPQIVKAPVETTEALVLDGDEHIREERNENTTRHFEFLSNANNIKMSKKLDAHSSAYVVQESDGLFHLTVCKANHYYDCTSFEGTPIIDIAEGLLFSLQSAN